mgnify:CR=1 FL=1
MTTIKNHPTRCHPFSEVQEFYVTERIGVRSRGRLVLGSARTARRRFRPSEDYRSALGIGVASWMSFAQASQPNPRHPAASRTMSFARRDA